MAVSNVSLANQALGNIASKTYIDDLNETSQEAAQIRLQFDTVRDALLRRFDWSFNRAVVQLAQIEEPPVDQWQYQYGYPADTLWVKKLVWGRRTDTPLPFEVSTALVTNTGQWTKVIWSDQAPPVTAYIRRKITDPTQFDVLFDEAFAWALAAKVAWALTRNVQTLNLANAEAARTLAIAVAQNNNEGGSFGREQHDATWIEERGGEQSYYDPGLGFWVPR